MSIRMLIASFIHLSWLSSTILAPIPLSMASIPLFRWRDLTQRGREVSLLKKKIEQEAVGGGATRLRVGEAGSAAKMGGGGTRIGMGYGKDDAKHIMNTRPCVRVHSARCQKVKNKWFSAKDEKHHPDWMETEYQSPPRASAADKGEWQIVWHPRSRPNTVTVPTRKVMQTLKDDEEMQRLKTRLAKELIAKGGSGTDPGPLGNNPPDGQRSQGSPIVTARDGARPQRDQLASQASNRSRLPTGASRGTQRALHTGGSGLKSERERPASTLAVLNEVAVVSPAAGSRVGTALTRASRVSKASAASRRSRSSVGTSSTLTRNSGELLARIKGLEDALLQEKTLRERMQSMLALEAFAESS